jgi:hypothetical protein
MNTTPKTPRPARTTPTPPRLSHTPIHPHILDQTHRSTATTTLDHLPHRLPSTHDNPYTNNDTERPCATYRVSSASLDVASPGAPPPSLLQTPIPALYGVKPVKLQQCLGMPDGLLPAPRHPVQHV